MNRPFPMLATLLGLAGLIPFIACGLASLSLEADRAMIALVAYGAVILAFLGGVHWGFALQDPDARGERPRLLLGVAPSLVGWVAILLAVAVRAEAGIALVVVGIIGVNLVEVRAYRAGLMTRAYLNLRYLLSGAVSVVLVAVLIGRIVGVHLILW